VGEAVGVDARPRPAHPPPAIDAVAESLPLPDDAFDAAITTFSVQQWGDMKAKGWLTRDPE